MTTPNKVSWPELLQEAQALFIDDTIANLANVSALLKQRLDDINWVGFYLLKGETLVLGPFQGLPACTTIAKGRGVCGAAVERRQAIRVSDVHEFPGHIACDARSRSELVVPLISNGQVLGVLDIDSPSKDRFSLDDELGAVTLGKLIESKAFHY